MHRLPQFLVINGETRRKKKAPKKPKLERMNARKNIDYEFPSTSTSEEVSVRGTRSLDIASASLIDRTSFRIDGSDAGQVEIICRSLGFESSEDFGIPLSSWETRRIRSTSGFLPSSRLSFDTPDTAIAIEQEQPTEIVGDDVIRVGGSNRVRNGIRGVRPPLLSPPSSSIPKPPLIHRDAGSEWDNVRTFGSSSAHVNQQDFRLSEQEEEEKEEEADVETLRARLEGTTTGLSASCSFTTSNEDDSSSTTTEPASSISPNGYGSNISTNGRFRHITITHWQRGELLGRGSFGSVYEGICDGGYFIAVKEVSLLDQGEQGRQSVLQLEQEIALLSQFEHENIVRYYGTDKDEAKLYIFLELVTKGSLLSLYQRYHLQDCQVSSYTRQILHGLKYLHDRSVVHRDVKCANILVDANGSVKLADFGLAKATKLNDVKSCKGTAFWMAPEVVNQKKKGYGLAADIWSLGCTVLEMLTRQIPYSPMECMAALYRIGNGKPPPVPEFLSGEARDFIFQCLNANPRDRPTASQLLDHPFVRRPLPSFLEITTSRS